VSEQYATDANLRARIDLHQRFSTAAEDWHRWLFERVAPGPGASILEVGCGPAEFWKRNLDRLDPSWRLTLTDLSPGMIDAARQVLGEKAEYAVADVEELPFADESFDVVLACHMLYHVPDRPKAFAEIRRVLVCGGVLHAATNGQGHLRQLDELVGDDWDFARHCDAFGLESGAAQLAAFFAELTEERQESWLEVTELEPLVAYVASSSTFRGDIQQVRRAAEEALEREGVFRVEAHPGVLRARKP
jgi:ubiquinone/menaquinone biosynthesis C-methylase UbiE